MKISVSKGNQNFRPMHVNGFKSLARVMKTYNYSLGQFKNNDRKAVNFISADAMGLDFDAGLSIKKATEIFKDFKHVITPTRSHKKKKNGKYEDRFRVILFFNKTVTSEAVYRNTVAKFLKEYPQADRACSDASRMFYPSQHGPTSTKETGQLVEPVIKKRQTVVQQTDDTMDYKKMPEGFTNCKWAIANGLFESGERNSALMALVTHLRHLEYTKGMAYSLALNALERRQERTGTEYDADDLMTSVVEQIYDTNWRGASYTCKQEGTWLNNYCDKLGDDSCQHERSTFNFQTLDQFYKEENKITWFVKDLLSDGSCSVFAGPPKAGKSTMIRQLIQATLTGGHYLGRKVNKGSVMYLALEEHKGLLQHQLSNLKIQAGDDMILHVGGVNKENAVRDLEHEILKFNPSLVIVDTLGHIFKVENLNDYGEVNTAFSKYRDLARKTNAHIMFVHHSTKGEDRGQNGILGSVAISGATDCNLVFNKDYNDVRSISSTQRGGKPFYKQKLLYNPETEMYHVDNNVEPDEKNNKF